ncbi:MAG: TIGR04283 family arsenosugar biosynthesis glycosyltransferase [Desulfobacterales bacterium]
MPVGRCEGAKMVAEREAMNTGDIDVAEALIIVFTRFPDSGQVKTRLIPSLGPDGAATLQKKMTEFAIEQAGQSGIPMQIRFTEGTGVQMREWLGVDCEYIPQGDGDLGERMERAFSEAFEAGAKKVVIIGTDCPDNRASNMRHSVRLLDQASCVIGPACDGGYYLIGLSAPQPELFRHISWGTDRVFQQTIAKTGSYRLLPMLNDVDRPEDIPPKISVIVPTLNEELSIRTCIETISSGFNTEAVVVDGGSLDNTRSIVEEAGAAVFTTAEGRASQMNYGAKNATGEILLFLHADSELPQTWDRHVREVIKRHRAALGYFRFSAKGCFPGKRLVEMGVNLRSRLLNRPYGDQGLFLLRDVFNALGGYPEVPILEDLFLVRRAENHGRLQCADAALATSGRRWIKHGIIRTTLINQAVLLAAYMGGDLHKLKDAYRQGKNPFCALTGQTKLRKKTEP